MHKIHNDAMRFVLASAVMRGSVFRLTVLARARRPFRAVAPELGLDMDLLTRFCRQMEGHERLFRVGHSATLCAALVALGLGEYDAAIIALFISFLIHFYKKYRERYRWIPQLWPENFTIAKFKHEVAMPLDDKENVSIADPTQNVVVYSGFNPFVGSGVGLDRWFFTVDLTRQTDKAPTSQCKLGAIELLGAIDLAVQALKLPNTEVRDTIFVDGAEVSKLGWLQPCRFARPLQRVGPEIVAQCSTGEKPDARVYKWIRVYDGHSGVVLSYFLRTAVSGNVLFVEFSKHVLGAVRKKYRRIDSVYRRGPWVQLCFLGATMLGWPWALLAAPVMLVRVMAQPAEHAYEEKRERDRIDGDPHYDYGTNTSLREYLASSEYEKYFERVDGELFGKAVEKCVLESIADSLGSHGVDITELRRREDVILNQGIIVQGGDVNAKNVAVGTGARVGVNWKERGPGRVRANRR